MFVKTDKENGTCKHNMESTTWEAEVGRSGIGNDSLLHGQVPGQSRLSNIKYKTSPKYGNKI